MRLDRKGNLVLELTISSLDPDYDNQRRLMVCLGRVSDAKPIEVEYTRKQHSAKETSIWVTCTWESQELASVGAVMSFVRSVTTGDLTDLQIKPESVARIKQIAGPDWKSI
ncbi:hypothetical protein [Stenotrophomonas sp. PS02299]|uniref:hypothetical protein n=1 Tax=Stenotrophomonas TaxID=40323 RepID=UPI0013134332|nr:hypothetical protein [Stenotrophomonas sp. PS02299]